LDFNIISDMDVKLIALHTQQSRITLVTTPQK